MSGSSENSVEPNLTPILDMVFQLITFFMLVINFKTASMDLTLKLPVVGSARPVETKGQDLLVLNIDDRGTLKFYGSAVKDIPARIAAEAQQSRLAARRVQPDLKDEDDLPSIVVIRADKDTPFGLLNKTILECQKNGYRKFSLKALNRKKEE